MVSNYTIKMQFKGVLHPEVHDILFILISRYFYNLNFKYVHNTPLKSKIKIKYIQGGGGGWACNSTERPKTRRLRRKGYTAKTNKD